MVMNGAIFSYPTSDSVINNLKPLLDSYGTEVDQLFSSLGDQVYLNYVSVFQDDYLNNFGRQDDERSNNEDIVKNIQELKEEFDENNFFQYKNSIPF